MSNMAERKGLCQIGKDKPCGEPAIGIQHDQDWTGAYRSYEVCKDHAWPALKKAKFGEKQYGINIGWERYEVVELKFYRSSDKYGYLSNLYKCKVVYEDIEFSSSEHAYQYGKAKSAIVQDYILNAPSPALACIVGHGLFPYMVVPNWKDQKVKRMKEILLAKFTQNKTLQKRLLMTDDNVLIEDSPDDGFWGIGRSGKGKNMLGKLLMEVREELKPKKA